MNKTELNNLVKFRRLLHSEPELSGNETKTSKKVVDFISRFSPDKIIKNLGGNGIAFVFEGSNPGPAVLFRSELDALPINEENVFNYKSKQSGVSHKCGHDGHMTILAGLAQCVAKSKPVNGKVILLYQPSEETGEGALRILSDKKFDKIKPDYVFALHNLPGFPKNKIILRKRNFAATSKGMIIKLIGKTSHAGEPEKGINPSKAVAETIRKFSSLVKDIKRINDFCLVTVIHVKIGERAFGTSPGYAEVMATFRSYREEDMWVLINTAEKFLEKIAAAYNLKQEISYTEEFPATVNDEECVDIIKKAASLHKYKTGYVKKPFRWTEDFGHFTNKFKGALFGIGSGIDYPQLHNPDYDFPDEIILTGINVFHSIIKLITGPN